MKDPEDEEFERLEREIRSRENAALIKQQAEKMIVLTHYYMKFCPSCRSLFADAEGSND